MADQIHKGKWLALWTGIACLLVGAIAYLSVAPTFIDLPGRGDKYAHIAGYAILMFWIMQICRGGRSRLLAGIGLALLGTGLEVVQSYSDYRNFGRGDLLADAIGIALGWLVGPPRTRNVLERLQDVA